MLPACDPAWTERVGTVDAFARTLQVLRANGVTPAMLHQAAQEVTDGDGGVRARLNGLAEVLTAQDAALAARHSVARATVETRLTEALAAETRSPEDLDLPARSDPCGTSRCCPPRARASSRRSRAGSGRTGAASRCRSCASRGGCASRAPSTARCGCSKPTRARASEVQPRPLRDARLPPVDPALTRWITALATGGRAHTQYDPEATETLKVPVVLAEAHGPDDEARWIAARVERWLKAGWAADTLAVVARTLDDATVDPLGRALDEARIPWVDGRGVRLWSSPLARALLGLPRVVARGAEREEVLRALAVIHGNAPRGGDAPPWRIAALLRDLSVESFFDTELHAKLAAARQRGVGAAVTRTIEDLARDLWALAQDGPVEAHAERLGRWIEQVAGDGRLAEESRAVIVDAGMDVGSQTILRGARAGRGGADRGAGARAGRSLRRRWRRSRAGRAGRIGAGDFGEMVLDPRARPRRRGAPGRATGAAMVACR